MTNIKKKLVIIPTYNEKDNIEKLIAAVNRLKIEQLDILIIDDNSPDGTASAVKELANKFNNIFLMERKAKMGLGTAYLAGFDWALNRNYDLIIEMDADFSHNPGYLPQLIKQSDRRDFVIGSRYVAGGGVSNWSRVRRLISRCGSLYARIILGLKIKDLTGGFNAWNASVLRQLKLGEISSNGYSFQIEMKYRAVQAGFSYCELPIIFSERENGQSKMSKKIVWEAIWRVLFLKFNKDIHQ